ncbi:MAG: glycosyltransferase family 39 protein [Nocardioidaceae bacterium]
MTAVAPEQHFLRPLFTPFARGPVLAAMITVAGVLTVASPAYGYHRDELYFRMLPLDWGYVDQPPLTPLLARMFSAIADETWAIHIPATMLMCLSILMVALITRELGGDRDAQTLCAWAYGTSLLPLEFARVLLTATVDLVVWPAVILFTMRAVLRNRPQWWLAAGLLTGVSMYNKLLIALLLVGLAAGIALLGPRQLLRSRWVWGAAGIALLVGAPNLLYQATHDWPQLTMGQALAEHNASQVRLLTLPILLVMLGLPLVPIWVAGFVELLRRPRWRPVRYVAAAFPVVLVLVFIGGSQFYYPLGLMTALLAAGCVVVGRWAATGPPSRAWTVVAAVAVNAVTSIVIALPLVPLEHLGSTPIPTVNQIAQDQVGWPAYVREVARVRATLPDAQVADAVIIAENYGEAGAIARYGPAHGMDEVYSAQNELYFMDRPPDAANTAIVIGTTSDGSTELFESCNVAGRLDNKLGVENQEQGVPISICRGPIGGWDNVWPKMQHYD